jgi:hypothetical protein
MLIAAETPCLKRTDENDSKRKIAPRPRHFNAQDRGAAMCSAALGAELTTAIAKAERSRRYCATMF